MDTGLWALLILALFAAVVWLSHEKCGNCGSRRTKVAITDLTPGLPDGGHGFLKKDFACLSCGLAKEEKWEYEEYGQGRRTYLRQVG